MSKVLRGLLIGTWCGCVPTTTTDDDATDTDEECEVFDLAMWCHNTEGGGPDPAVPDCLTPTVAELLAGQADAWSGQCDSPSHGLLTVVNQPTGYGGPYWYFDDADTFVAFRYTTDINVYCDGAAFNVSYGFEPDCEISCELTDPSNVASLPTC